MGVFIIFAVEVDKLTFKYNSKENFSFHMEDLSFKIEENSIFALTGNNGAGKTTLLRLLVGLLKPKSGNIRIFNEALT